MDGPVLEQFEGLVNQYQREMINFHYRFVGNRPDAEDLAQETFLKAYLKFDTLREPEKVKSWLMSIARNTVVDFFRTNKDRSVSLEDAEVQHAVRLTGEHPHERIADAQVARELQQCIDRLVKEDQAIVRLLYYEGFSYQEIGDLLHMNQNTLKSRLHRARKVLLAAIRGSLPLGEVVLEYDHGTK